MYRAAYDDTGQVPEALRKKPVLPKACRRYLDAFRLLSDARTWNQGHPMPIQISEVNALLESMGISDPQTKIKYQRLVRRMDQVELAHILQQVKS